MPGATGGSSAFGDGVTAKGGLGGAVMTEGNNVAVVGPAGAYTPGFTGANIFGSGSGYTMPGVRYSGLLAMGGPGGSSVLGEGAGSQAIVGEGINANGPGGGGGGAGGTIYVTVRSGNIPLNLQANGGNGGQAGEEVGLLSGGAVWHIGLLEKK